MRKALLARGGRRGPRNRQRHGSEHDSTDNPSNGTAAGNNKMNSSTTPGAMGANQPRPLRQ